MRHAPGSPLEGPVFKSSLVTLLGARLSTKGGDRRDAGPSHLSESSPGWLPWLALLHLSGEVSSSPLVTDWTQGEGRHIFLCPPQSSSRGVSMAPEGVWGVPGQAPSSALPRWLPKAQTQGALPVHFQPAQGPLVNFRERKTKRTLAYP